MFNASLSSFVDDRTRFNISILSVDIIAYKERTIRLHFDCIAYSQIHTHHTHTHHTHHCCNASTWMALSVYIVTFTLIFVRLLPHSGLWLCTSRRKKRPVWRVHKNIARMDDGVRATMQCMYLCRLK